MTRHYADAVDELREGVLAAEAALGSRAAAWDAVLATVATAHGLVADFAAPPDLPALAPWRDPAAADLLGAVHESLVAQRHDSGTYYTPAALVAWMLDRTLTSGAARVFDPACGSGHVLIAVVRRLVSLGVPPADAVARVHGVDLDPVAVAITRLLLCIEAPDADPDVRVADGLDPHPGAPFDLVVGNPPFLGQLRAATARASTSGLGPYTDLSAVFLHHALTQVDDGGCVALVQPLSVLAARDAAPVRSAISEGGAVVAFWSSMSPVFPGASVLTCVPVVETGAVHGDVATWHGPGLAAGPAVPMPDTEWGPLAAPAAGVPAVRITPTHGVLADLASCTADFRDQYYGLVPFVSDGGPGAPLVTSGLIDPAHCRWGETSTRFAKTRYDTPTVDLDALHAEGSLAAWATARLVPKVLVATQGRVIEAVVDVDGAWLPSVPVLTVVPAPHLLWHVLAVLLAPPVTALAAARYLGTALAPTAIKLSAAQVARLPLPRDHDAWDDAAVLARRAQETPLHRAAILADLAATMCAAYGDVAALSWWLARRPGERRVTGTGHRQR